MARSPEFSGTGAAAFTAGALIAQQVVGKALRDALFLTVFDVSDLPGMMVVGALLSLTSAAALSYLLQRYSPRRVLPVLFAVSAVAFCAEWMLGQARPAWMTVAFYIHMALLGPALISAFWSLINERYDPYNAKRAVARIAGGATIGGVVGGIAVWQAASVIELGDLVLAMSGIHVTCLVGTTLMRGTARSAHVSQVVLLPGQGRRGLRAVVRAPLLRNLAIVVAIGSATSSLLDYLLSSTATQAFGKGASLLEFFALFWLSVAVVSMIVQFTLGERVLARLGLTKNIAALPGLLLVGATFTLAIPSIAAFVVLRGFEAVQRNTVYRSAYELFYTPIPESRKRAAKALIDIGFDRLGTIVGAGLVALLIAVGADNVSLYVLFAIAVLSAGTLPIVRRLQAGYIAALEGGLRDTASKDVIRDEPKGLEPLAAEPADEPEASLPVEPVSAGHGPIADALRDPRLVLDGRELITGAPDAAKALLHELTRRSAQPTVAYAIMLLAHRDLHIAAFDALSKISAVVTGQLTDVLVDGDADLLVRRRVARVLAHSGTQRGLDALLLGTTDSEFAVRYTCSRALAQLTMREPRLQIDRAKVLHGLLVELDHRTREPARPKFVADPVNDAPVFVMRRPHAAVDHTLEHVFTMVGLHVAHEQLQMAYGALQEDDARQRGTALEYLQTILPADFRDAVWPFVDTLARVPPRSARTVLAELIRTTSVQRPRP